MVKLWEQSRVGAALSTLMLVTLVYASAALAHELRPAVADVIVSEDRLVVELDLTLEPLAAGLDLSAIFDTNDSPKAEEHDRLRALAPEELAQQLRDNWPQIAESFRARAGDTALALELDGVEVGAIGDVELPRDSKITIRADLPQDGSAITFGWAAANGAIVVRQILEGQDGGYEAFLTNGDITAPIPRVGAAEQSWIEAFTNFIVVGFEHIIPKGLDHILFVLGLFFFSLKMRPLLWQVSAFTLAHTVTLALATLGLVNVPGSIVEPLIAASIVYVAVENVFVRQYHQWRAAVVFGFGLLHGLGFASVLGDVGLNPSMFVSNLIGFNIGVEIGQLTVIAAAYLLVGWWAGSKDWYRNVIATPASIAIAIVGAWWFIERVFL